MKLPPGCYLKTALETQINQKETKNFEKNVLTVMCPMPPPPALRLNCSPLVTTLKICIRFPDAKASVSSSKRTKLKCR